MNQDNYHVTSDEISLQDLFTALWRQKLLIIITTVLAGLITGIISVFAITPVYHAKLNIIINMPEIHQTKYGEYSLPITTNEQYINLITSNDILKNTIEDMGYDPLETTIESLRDRITIVKTDSKNTIQNSFEIRLASDNPEEARRFAQVLYNNYIEFLDVFIAEGATKYFTDYYMVQLKSLQVQLETDQELLAKNIDLLDNTPKTINQKEAMDEVVSSDKTSSFIVMENVVNPNYLELELDVIRLKQAINSTQNTIDLYNTYLAELDAKYNEISMYYETGEFKELSSNIVRITKSNIYLPSDPVSPNKKTSPSNSRNVIIATILGAMVSVLIGLVREFWFKKDIN